MLKPPVWVVKDYNVEVAIDEPSQGVPNSIRGAAKGETAKRKAPKVGKVELDVVGGSICRTTGQMALMSSAACFAGFSPVPRTITRATSPFTTLRRPVRQGRFGDVGTT